MTRASAPPPFFVDPDDPPAKQAMLRAALELFVRKGLCETTVRDIAEASGYSNPALFKHFVSKDALALHLFERCYERFASEIASAVYADERFAIRLRMMLEHFVSLLEENPEALVFAQDHLRHFWRQADLRLRRHSVLGLVRRLLEVGLAEGVVGRDVDLELATAAIAGSLGQLSRQYYFAELSGDSSTWVEGLERLLIRMLGPRTPSSTAP